MMDGHRILFVSWSMVLIHVLAYKKDRQQLVEKNLKKPLEERYPQILLVVVSFSASLSLCVYVLHAIYIYIYIILYIYTHITRTCGAIQTWSPKF